MSITLVSAFFDIGREKYEVLPRSKEKYINDFKRWARIQNDLIFFCDNKVIGDKVMEIRKEFGRENNTKIIVKDIFEVEPEILNKMEAIEKDPYFLNFRKLKETPENKANYNYVVFMKFYCIYEASKIINFSTQLNWIDFGFEHGGGVFLDESDYDFLWDYDFGNKINLFRLPYEETRPIFEVCRTIHPDSLMGGIMVIPSTLAEDFWNCAKNSTISLCDVGLMDDDQLIELMISRKLKDKVIVHQSNWFMPIRDFGGSHFKLKPKPKKPNIFKRGFRKIKRIIKNIINKG